MNNMSKKAGGAAGGAPQTKSEKAGGAAGIEIDYNNNPEYSAMAGQTAFPYFQDLDRMRQIVARIVKKTMSEACADNCSDQRIIKERVNPFRIDAFTSPHSFHDFITDSKPFAADAIGRQALKDYKPVGGEAR